MVLDEIRDERGQLEPAVRNIFLDVRRTPLRVSVGRIITLPTRTADTLVGFSRWTPKTAGIPMGRSEVVARVVKHSEH